jgi:nucleoside-diphosphate-sugar epimerase
MRALVTGATGFTGSHLVRHLLTAGYEVRVLVRPASLPAAEALGPVEIALGDLRDRGAVDEAVRGADRVFHLGALFREARHPESVYREINVGGTEHVLAAALRHRVGRVVHCSTTGIMAYQPGIPADETAPYKADDVYQETKLAAERTAVEYARERGLPLAVVRPAMVWGEGDRRMLKLFRAVARGRFVIIGDGRTMFHFAHVDDVCRGFLLAAERTAALGQIYVIAGAEPVRLADVAERIARANGAPVRNWHVPAAPVLALSRLVEMFCVPLGLEPPIYPRRVRFFLSQRWFSIEKAERELGFRPTLTLDQEIEQISRWYRERGWFDRAGPHA